ncbi:hypothetical protein Pmani_031866 [Petrolisthes manimaculis]|uniref:Uncharacterized protein n=1 Tax=Petrolisthes manimaculis TaxID=1843537 RepID=A0AAE1TUC7_9EUCA|nr:hypothetical protein Pmani_031866 [Petrolisthes manimaculis]
MKTVTEVHPSPRSRWPPQVALMASLWRKWFGREWTRNTKKSREEEHALWGLLQVPKLGKVQQEDGLGWGRAWTERGGTRGRDGVRRTGVRAAKITCVVTATSAQYQCHLCHPCHPHTSTRPPAPPPDSSTFTLGGHGELRDCYSCCYSYCYSLQPPADPSVDKRNN